MLLAEYDYDTDIAIQRAAEREIPLQRELNKALSGGFPTAYGKLSWIWQNY